MDKDRHKHERKEALKVIDYGETFEVAITAGGRFIVLRKDNDDDGEGPTLKTYETIDAAYAAIDRFEEKAAKAAAFKFPKTKVLAVTVYYRGYGKNRTLDYTIETLEVCGVNANSKNLMLKRGGRSLDHGRYSRSTRPDAYFKADEKAKAEAYVEAHKAKVAAETAFDRARDEAMDLERCYERFYGRMDSLQKEQAERALAKTLGHEVDGPT